MKTNVLSFAALAVLSGGVVWSQQPNTSISQIVSGGGWKTTLTLMNVWPEPHSVSFQFRGDDGRPLALPLVITQDGASQEQTSSQLARTVQPNATLLIESEASTAATLVGWVDLIHFKEAFHGFAILRYRSQDGRDAEATVPLEKSTISRLILPFDNTAGFVTGAALANLHILPVIVNAVIRDDSGTQIDLQAVALPANGHTSFVVGDKFPSSRGRRGIIEFQNIAGTITGLGLRFGPSGSFTSVPVILMR